MANIYFFTVKKAEKVGFGSMFYLSLVFSK